MSIKVVIVGAGGLVGLRMVEALVAMKEFGLGGTETLPLGEIVLFDMRDISGDLGALASDSRVRCVAGDLTDRPTLDKLFAPDGATRVTVIQLAAVLSGYAESNFELGMKVNLHGAIGVMDALRAVGEKLGGPQVYVFTSTDYVAAYNEANKATPVTEESFRLSPVSYGVQKACVELLLCDYSRKGFVDGRVGRLSAVLGRPGWSNSISWSYTGPGSSARRRPPGSPGPRPKARSCSPPSQGAPAPLAPRERRHATAALFSTAAGIFTTTLEGKDFEVPGVLPMDRPFPCSCVQNNVASLLYLASEVRGADLGHNRVVQIAAKSYTLSEIWAACQKVAAAAGIAADTLGKVTQGALPKEATVTELNVCPAVNCAKAEGLGMPMEVDIETIIADYVARHVKKEEEGEPEAKRQRA